MTVTMILNDYSFATKPSSISSREFCDSNKVRYNLFEKWYKNTRSKIVPVQVIGTDSMAKQPEADQESKLIYTSELRILVDIHTSNGIHIHQKNVSYSCLK